MAADTIKLHYDVPSDDFTRAGEASSDLKGKLKQMGIDPGAIRKVAIALYEAEINMVIHADGGVIDVEITKDKIHLFSIKSIKINAIINYHCSKSWS